MQPPSPLQDSTSGNVRQSATIFNGESVGLNSHPEHRSRRSSSNGGQKKATVSTRRTVAVHVAAMGSGRWTDETGSTAGSVDCSVRLESQHAVKDPARAQQGRPSLRKWIIGLVVIGVTAAAVLVPISLIVGFTHRRPAATTRAVPPPAAAYKVIFAFADTIKPTSESAFPPAVAQQVIQWVALPSSGIHVATFASHQAKQQAMAVLRNMANLKYAVADFQLLPDRSVSGLVNPDQLLELSKQPGRQLLQQANSRKGSTASEHNSAHAAVSVPQASKLVETHKQRLAERKARRQLLSQQKSLASHYVPSSARIPLHWHTSQQEQQEPAGASQQQAATPDEATATSPQPSHPAPGTLCANCSTSHHADSAATSDNSKQHRQLKQYQEPPPSPEPQPQQRQALLQPQNGGGGVAWYLADSALQLRESWNITYGFDEIVVAVLDSGIELSHEGVGAAVWANAGEVAGDGFDNDGNGFIDDVMGWDFGGSCSDAACSSCTPGPDPSDISGWGTHAASVIAAQPEVASGTSGIAPGVRVMALKIADCRGGMQLGDYSAQQLAAGYHSVGDAGSELSDWAAVSPGPVLVGSAAVQALDYALLNGAHIVLAAWQAGELLDTEAPAVDGATGSQDSSSSSSPPTQCVLGAARAAAGGVQATAADGNDTAACVTAVQQMVFQDAFEPLRQAGVLVITMQPVLDESSDTGSSSSDSSSLGAAIPCQLGLTMSNVVCVGPSAASEGSTAAVNEHIAAADLFEPLLFTMNRNLTAEAEKQNEPQPADQFSNAHDSDMSTYNKTMSGVSINSQQDWAQLRAPGDNILAGWAWASHAAVSGGSAAAAVAAGAAALTWSALGQTIGSDASAGAFEGLADLVKQYLTADGTGSVHTAGLGDPSSSTSSREVFLMERGGAGAKELSLLQSVKAATAYTGPLQLEPAQISPSITAVTNTLSYTWHISTVLSGPYATDQMAFVARKALLPPYFPITNWEFYGSTSLVEVQGFLLVDSPGNYSVAAITDDRFILWLGDKWLMMQEAGYLGQSGALPDATAWATGVNFKRAGYYKVRIIVYNPGLSSFDLQWQLPGTSSYTAIPKFVSFGRTQPVPQQLVNHVTSHMVTSGSGIATSRSSGSGADGVHGSSSSSRGSSDAPADTIVENNAAGDSGSASTVVVSPRSTSGGSSSSNAEQQTPYVASVGAPVPAAEDANPTTASAAAAVPEPQQQAQHDPTHQQVQEPAYPHPSQPYADPTAVTKYPNVFNFGGLNGFLQSIFGWERGGNAAPSNAASPGAADEGSDASRGASVPNSNVVISPPDENGQIATQPMPPTRSLLGLQNPPSLAQRSASPLPGVFSVAAALVPQSDYRTILPPISNLRFDKVGILPGPGMQVTANWQLQELLFGSHDAADDRAGYGMVQGWLDWRTLNPQAQTWLQELLNPGPGSTSGQLNPGPTAGGVYAGTAGVQFQLTCASHDTQMGCSLHTDGQAVVGALDETQLSSCIVPARRLLTSNSTAPASDMGYHMHIGLLFVAGDMRAAQFAVKARPCSLSSDGSVQVASGAAGSFNTLVPSSSQSALGLTSSAVQAGAPTGAVSGGYQPGMLCSVTATVPPAVGNLSGQIIQRTVYLTADDLQRAVSVDESTIGSHAVDTTVNYTRAEATAKGVAGTPGIGVQQLAPDWVQSLPWNTLYGFTCGCFWNGSWAGNVSVGVHAGGSGTAALYLAGWPVAASPLLPLYGPSDIDVTLYSSWIQQQQLISGSSVADSLRWQANLDDVRFPAAAAAAADAASRAAVLAQLGFRPLGLQGGDVFTLGVIGAVDGYAVPVQAGYLQLLVLQGDRLDSHGRVVMAVAVPGSNVNNSSSDASSSGGNADSKAAHGIGNSTANATGSSNATSSNSTDSSGDSANEKSDAEFVAAGWLPGRFDAWVPV